MKVGLVIYGALDTVSGGYLYDRQLVQALVAAGHQVEIIALPWRSYGAHLLDNLSIALYRQLTSPRFDLLLQDELNHPSLAGINWLVRRRSRTPIVAIVHHLRASERWPAWQRCMYQAVERAYCASVDAFVVNSPTTSREVARLGGRPRPVCVALPAADRWPTAIDRATVVSRSRSSPPLRLVAVGNVSRRKGLHTLVAAVALLPPATWRLDIVGSLHVEPAHARHVAGLIAAFGLSQQIVLHDRVDDAALAAILTRSHVLALPSTYEGFGIAYIEGMRFGLPAIGTTAGAARDAIADGTTGMLVAPDDPADLARALTCYLTDEDLLTRHALAALDAAQRHPTWAQTTAAIVAFLEQVVADRNRVGPVRPRGPRPTPG